MNELSGLPAKLMEERVELPKPRNSMGKDDFMKLLMSQLQHQDPLKPMDHQEFASQLAQFGQLEQLTNIQTGISGLKNGMGDDAKVQALSMIGKRIQANGSELELVQGQNIALNATFPENVRATKAVISDGNGRLVREINLNEGSKEILWDGKDQEGVSLPSGKYLFRVHGVGPDGQPKAAGSELSGRVIGVEMDGVIPTLVVQSDSGQSKIAMTKVKRVMIDGEPSKNLAKNPEVGLSMPQPQQKTTRSVPLEMPKVVSAEPMEEEDAGLPPMGHDPNSMFVNNMMEVMRR